MKKLLYVAVIYIASVSCVKRNINTVMNPGMPMDSTSQDDTAKSYLALGDSYTIGESVAEQDRYPVQTVNLLRLQHIDITDPDIIATTGWTTTDLISALDIAKPKNNYSVVSLLIGVNNQYQHKSMDEYKTEFAELLQRSIAYAAGKKEHVFVISIPDYSVTPFAANLNTAQISKEINAFNNANETISLAAGVHYLDITPISREAKTNASFIAGDGLHPSGNQYKQWSILLAPVMQAELQ